MTFLFCGVYNTFKKYLVVVINNNFLVVFMHINPNISNFYGMSIDSLFWISLRNNENINYFDGLCKSILIEISI